MNCPVCNIQLNMTERQGVEIDYCSKCRGVWLDRGELDKIIERSAGATNFTANTQQQHNPNFNQPPPQYPTHQSGYNQQHHYQNQHHEHSHRKHKKRDSFLGELFDFD